MPRARLQPDLAGTITAMKSGKIRAVPPCLVWVPADHRLLGDGDSRTSFTVLADEYARALRDCAGAQPVVFALAEVGQIPALLALVDGVLLSGSASNVHPAHFGQAVADPALPLDPARDAMTLALVDACLEQAVPLLGVCRGFQEINVALGGSLHQQVHRVDGMLDHREPPERPPDVQYGPAHCVTFVPGCAFEHWAGGSEARVNSLHGQGIDRLGARVRALGRAPDGLVEAIEIEGAGNFAYAVQWHPEWFCMQNRFDGALFGAFGEACRKRRDARRQSSLEGPDGPDGSVAWR